MRSFRAGGAKFERLGRAGTGRYPHHRFPPLHSTRRRGGSRGRAAPLLYAYDHIKLGLPVPFRTPKSSSFECG